MQLDDSKVGQWHQWIVKTKPNGKYLNLQGYPDKQIEATGQGSPPPTAGQQVMDHLAGKAAVPDPPPTQQDYEAKERKKVIGMCMTGHVNARLVNTPPTELLEDKAQFAALWQIATRIVDGTGQVQEGPNF